MKTPEHKPSEPPKPQPKSEEEIIEQRRKEQEMLNLMRIYKKKLHFQYNNDGNILDILGGAHDASFWDPPPGRSSVPIHPLAPDDNLKDSSSRDEDAQRPKDLSQIVQMEEDSSAQSATPN
ncbi:putative condensin complex subunit 1 isoform X1 [Sesbania bispinosa]|nr:putative condensin complex subunit 1 isoform X1 [Sesbania bispinosa]